MKLERNKSYIDFNDSLISIGAYNRLDNWKTNKIYLLSDIQPCHNLLFNFRISFPNSSEFFVRVWSYSNIKLFEDRKITIYKNFNLLEKNWTSLSSVKYMHIYVRITIPNKRWLMIIYLHLYNFRHSVNKKECSKFRNFEISIIT